MCLANRKSINQMKPEVKYHDVVLTQSPMDWDGTIFKLNAIGAGTQSNQRIGDQLTLKGIHLRLAIDSGNVSVPLAFRIIIYMENVDFSTSAFEVLQLTGNINIPNSPKIVDTRKDYKFLYDIRGTSSPNGNVMSLKKFYIPLNSWRCYYAAESPNIETWSLKCLFCSDISTGAINKPLLSGNFRISFTDS